MSCQPIFSLAPAFLQQVMTALWLLHRAKLFVVEQLKSERPTPHRHDYTQSTKVVLINQLMFDLAVVNCQCFGS